MEGEGVLRVYDILGQLVESKTLTGVSGQVTIGEGLKNGAYLVRIEGRDGASRAVRLVKIN